MGPLMLSIDFGTSNTASAYRDRQGAVHEVRLTTAGTLMPSAVLYSAGQVLVGRTALQAAFTAPEAFEPTPKRRLADREIFLAGTMVNVTELAAAVFAEVLARAGQVMGAAADEIVITHPDQWAQPLQRLLVAAAVAGGVDEQKLRLISEAQAAAWFYARTAPDLGAGSRLVVFDFGAGTCDVAALDRQPDGSFAVIAAEGLEGLGGQDMDARIHTWVRRQLAATDPVLLAEVNNPEAVATRLTLNDRIRDAKEALSESSSAAIVVAGSASTQVLQLTRDEFDELIGADIDRAVALTKRVIDTAHTRRPTPHPPTIYLTGGSASIPLVHTRLATLGPIGVLGDPKTVVVQGALDTPSPHSAVAPPQFNPLGVPPPVPAQYPTLAFAGTSQQYQPTAPAGTDPNHPTVGFEAPTQMSFPSSFRHDGSVPNAARSRGKAMIIGVGSAAVVAATAIALVGFGVFDRVASTHTATTTKARPVQAALGDILLTAADINTVMGASGMTADNTSDQLAGQSDILSNESCEGALYSVMPSVYQGTGYTDVRWQLLMEPGDHHDHWVNQAVVSFPSAAQATTFLTTSSSNWKSCAGQSVTVTPRPDASTTPGAAPTPIARWTFGDVSAGHTTLTQTATQEAGGGWACRHALKAVSNLIIDVQACEVEVGMQGDQIAEKMARKAAA